MMTKHLQFCRILPVVACTLLVMCGCRGPVARGHTMAWASGGVVCLQTSSQEVDTLGPGFYPALSPDGFRIAFIRDVPGSGASQIVVLNRASGEEEVVLESADPLMDLSWSPDGNALAFVSASPDGSRALEVCAPDGSLLTTLWSGPGAQGLVFLRPSWLPDSKGLLFNDESALYRIFLDGTMREWITVEAITHNLSALSLSDRFAVCPSDTTLIAYTRLLPATTSLTVATSVSSTHALFVYDIDSGSSLQMTTSDMCALDPVWASDGSVMVFWGYDSGMAREGIESVFVLDYASGLWEPLAPGQCPAVD